MELRPPIDDAVLQEMVTRLVTAFRPLRIYLFGSRARGEATEDSDYDLLVIVASSDQPQYRRAMAAVYALGDI
jgi:predicted nucleotidyltransferase